MVNPKSIVVTEKAADYFEQGKSYDKNVIRDHQDKIRPDLRGRVIDQSEARRFYKLAAEAGHPKGMNNYAVELLAQFQPTKDEYNTAFHWFERLAELGDYSGYNGMGGLLVTGFPGQPADDPRGSACLEKAAILAGKEDIYPALALASADLNVMIPLLNLPPKSAERIERGRTLLEDGIFSGQELAYEKMIDFYTFRSPSKLKVEYYARQAASLGIFVHHSQVDLPYRDESFGELDIPMSECIKALPRDQLQEVETLCPRADGPLTRNMAGLPLAPTEPLDISKYLQEFRELHPDL